MIAVTSPSRAPTVELAIAIPIGIDIPIDIPIDFPIDIDQCCVSNGRFP